MSDNIPYTVQKLSTILQSAWSWQTGDFNMALNASARATEQMAISLLIYMNYEPKLNEKDKRGCQVIPGDDQNTIPTNQGATGSKLDQTRQLTFYGSWEHLNSFSGDVLV